MPFAISQKKTFLAVLTAVMFFSGCQKHHETVTTYHYDNLRTGWNQAEHELTFQRVQSACFGLIQSVTLDDQVDTQPLVVPHVDIPTGPTPECTMWFSWRPRAIAAMRSMRRAEKFYCTLRLEIRFQRPWDATTTDLTWA
jgi:hypothetical protein